MTQSAKILLITFMFASFAGELFGPIYAIFVKQIGGDLLEAGAAYAVFMIVSGIFIFTVGRSKFFLSRLRPMVVVGYGLLTLGDLGYLLVDTPLKLFIVQIIFGIAGGILEPSWDAIYAAGLDEIKAASHWSLWAGLRNLVAGAAAFAGGVIVTAYSFNTLFIIMAIFNLIALTIIFKILKVPPAKEDVLK